MNVLLQADVLGEILKYLQFSDLAVLYATNTRALQAAFLASNVVISVTLSKLSAYNAAVRNLERALLEKGASVSCLAIEGNRRLTKTQRDVVAKHSFYSLRFSDRVPWDRVTDPSKDFALRDVFPHLTHLEVLSPTAKIKIPLSMAQLDMDLILGLPVTLETVSSVEWPRSIENGDEQMQSSAMATRNHLTTLELTACTVFDVSPLYRATSGPLRGEIPLQFARTLNMWISNASLTSITLYPTFLAQTSWMKDGWGSTQPLVDSYRRNLVGTGSDLAYVWPPNLRILRLAPVHLPSYSQASAVLLNLPTSLEEFTLLPVNTDDDDRLLIGSFSNPCNITTLVIELTAPQQELLDSCLGFEFLAKSLRTLTIYTVELRLAIYGVIQKLTGLTSLSILAELSQNVVPGKPSRSKSVKSLQWPSFRLPSSSSAEATSSTSQQPESSSASSADDPDSLASLRLQLAKLREELKLLKEGVPAKRKDESPVLNFAFPSSLTKLVVDAPPMPHMAQVLPAGMRHLGFTFHDVELANTVIRAFPNAYIELRSDMMDCCTVLPRRRNPPVNFHVSEHADEITQNLNRKMDFDLRNSERSSTKDYKLPSAVGKQDDLPSKSVEKSLRLHPSLTRAPSMIVEHPDGDFYFYTLVPIIGAMDYAKKRVLPELRAMLNVSFEGLADDLLSALSPDASVSKNSHDPAGVKYLYLAYWNIPDERLNLENLTHLIINDCVLDRFCLSHLPVSLVSLRSNTSTEAFVLLNGKLPSLTTLDAPRWQFSADAISRVSSSSMVVAVCTLPSIHDGELVDYWRHRPLLETIDLTLGSIGLSGAILPPGSSRLDPHALFETSIAFLQENIDLTPATQFFMSHYMQHLPASITDIDLTPMPPILRAPFRTAFVSPAASSLFTELPHDLTSLVLVNVPSFPHLQRVLPDALQTLNVTILAAPVFDHLPIWPASLQSLTLKFQTAGLHHSALSYSNYRNFELSLNVLPPTLMHLSISNLRPCFFGPVPAKPQFALLQSLKLIRPVITDYQLAEFLTSWAPNIEREKSSLDLLLLSGGLMPADMPNNVLHFSSHMIEQYARNALEKKIAINAMEYSGEWTIPVPTSVTSLDLIHTSQDLAHVESAHHILAAFIRLPLSLTKLRMPLYLNTYATDLKNINAMFDSAPFLKHLRILFFGKSLHALQFPMALEELVIDASQDKNIEPPPLHWSPNIISVPPNLRTLTLRGMTTSAQLPPTVSIIQLAFDDPLPEESTPDVLAPAPESPVRPSPSRNLGFLLKEKRITSRTSPSSNVSAPYNSNTSASPAATKSPFQFGSASASKPQQGFSFPSPTSPSQKPLFTTGATFSSTPPPGQAKAINPFASSSSSSSSTSPNSSTNPFSKPSFTQKPQDPQ